MRDILIIGAQKAGSTFLHNLLARDPRIAEPPVKEPHHFSSSLAIAPSWEALFAIDADSIARLDSSVSYLHIEGVAEKIHEALGRDPLILMTIRDPLDRAISSYFHAVKHGREIRPAAEALGVEGADYAAVRATEADAVRRALAAGRCLMRPARNGKHADEAYADTLFAFRYVANSFYGDQLAPFFPLFDRIRVIDFRRLVAEPDAVLAGVYRLLGLDPVAGKAAAGETNPTRVGARRVLARYYQNVRGVRAPVPALAATARALPAILSLDYDARALKAKLPSLTWVEPARAQYRALLASDLAL